MICCEGFAQVLNWPGLMSALNVLQIVTKKKEGKTKLKGQTVALYWLMLINGITNNSYE